MSSSRKARAYDGSGRRRAAEAARERILDTARHLLAHNAVDAVTLEAVAKDAGSSVASIHAAFGTKAGLIREVLRRVIFGNPYEAAAARLGGIGDPVERLRATAGIARAIYENEFRQLGTLLIDTPNSGEIRELLGEFDALRMDMQRARIDDLHRTGALRSGLRPDEARRVLWMYTSRDTYRMMVIDGGWTPDRFEDWLAETLVTSLCRSDRA